MENQCKNDARKSDAEMMENGAKMEPKGEPKSIKLSKKGIKKMTLKFDAKKRRFINLRQHRTGSALNLVFCDCGL